jgi:hypothetical protein
MKYIFLLALLYCGGPGNSQELYPYSEPASNMPARSVAIKSMSVFHRDIHSSRLLHRHLQDVMFGLNRNWMVHLGTNFSNMHQANFRWEGARVYAKYRFLSNDDVHKHFRMAAFAAGTYSRNHLDHNELNLLMGDQSGVAAGLIATQLWNRTAISATGSWNEVLDEQRWDKSYNGVHAVRSFNYSLSAGYLLLPFEYKDYSQTNINLYAELLGSRNIGFKNEKFYVDLAPSVQAIFNSTAKLNISHRFELDSDIYRLARNSWMISFEYIFLNALKRKTN